MSLSGQGIQRKFSVLLSAAASEQIYERRFVTEKDDPCKIWCQTLQDKNFYWTITNFPDGTECGTNKYCLKGECLVMRDINSI